MLSLTSPWWSKADHMHMSSVLRCNGQQNSIQDKISNASVSSKQTVSTMSEKSRNSGSNVRRDSLSGATKRNRPLSINEQLRAIMGDMITEEELLNRFTFGRQLGTGATCQVYAAIDNTTGQKVALKIFDKASMIELRRSMVADNRRLIEPAVTRVQRRLLKIVAELEICKNLDHPNIIKYLGAVETSHRLIIITEFVEGTDLLEYLLTKGKMEETVAADVFRQLLNALKYCHEKNLYHRDLKLENVLFTSDYRVKLIDFGLSEFTSPGETLKSLCGTPLYCSPEVLSMTVAPHKRSVGFHGGPADIWSVAVLLFALLTGCAPFDDSTFLRLREDVRQMRIPFPDTMSNEVKGLLKNILVFDPDVRPSIDDILDYEWVKQSESYRARNLRHSSSSTITSGEDEDRMQEDRMQQEGNSDTKETHTRPVECIQKQISSSKKTENSRCSSTKSSHTNNSSHGCGHAIFSDPETDMTSSSVEGDQNSPCGSVRGY